MENVVMYLDIMYNKLRNSPMPEEAKTDLNNATAEWDIAYDKGIQIHRLLWNVISNGM